MNQSLKIIENTLRKAKAYGYKMSKLPGYFLLSLIIMLSGCAAVTITETGEPNFRYYPNYEESKPFFLWGLIGDHRIDVSKICTEKPVVQMQTKFSSWDVLYSALTLGLYLPRTAKVWCERESEV